jgi:hypothetical protein
MRLGFALLLTLLDAGSTAQNGVDLLKLIDLKQDVIDGDWALSEGLLVCVKRTAWARVQIPYSPPDEYDLTLVAERREGLEAINIGLARGDRQFHAVVDGWGATMSGLSMIDNRWANNNETTARGRLLENGKPATIVVRVRNGGVSMTVDGKTVFDWKGDYARLGNIPLLSIPEKRAMYLNSFNSVYHFTKAHLKAVSGTGRRLR